MSETAESQQYCSRCLTTFAGDVEQCPNLGCRRKRPAEGWGRIYEQGEVFDRTYRVHKMLAVGGAGVTYIARELDADGEETGPRLAVKVLLAARDQGPYVRRLATEAQIIQELDHPNIVQYLGFVHRAGHSPYLITRFESGGSLLDHMRRVGTLSVKAACVVGRQICWALEKGHERGIVHRDLKPENVLLARPVPKGEDPVVRVADFGIAKVQGSLGGGITRVGAFVGTPHYAAPEQFVGGAVSEMADVYSVGAMLFFCMTARHVIRFADRLDPEDSFQLLCESLPPTVRRDQDPAEDVARINRVLSVAMAVDPLRRCSVVELDQMLEAILADREPKLPDRPRAEATDEISVATASVVGVAAALSGDAPIDPPAPAPAPPEPVATRESTERIRGDAHMKQVEQDPPAASSGGLSGAALVAGAAAVGAAAFAAGVAAASASKGAPAPASASTPVSTSVSPPAPSPTPAPAPAVQAAPKPAPAVEPEPPKPAGGKGVVVAIVLVVLLGLCGAAVLALKDQISGLSLPALGGGGAAVELTANESSKVAQRDWKAINRSVDEHEEWLRTACDVKGGGKARVEVVIEGDGSVRSANALGSGALAECVAERLGKANFSRTQSMPVRVKLQFGW